MRKIAPRAAAFILAFTLAGAAHAEEPLPLRVLTWNVWGLPAVSTNLESRMAALPDEIAKLDPDIVLLQEVWAESDGVTIRQGLARHGYRYAIHLAHTEAGMTGCLRRRSCRSRAPVSCLRQRAHRTFVLAPRVDCFKGSEAS